MIPIQGKYNTALVYTDIIEEEAISQIITLCNQEFTKDTKIRIMPDVHAGAGCTIGTTMTMKDKIVANLVGQDIGCGMFVVKLKQKRNEINLKELDECIKKYIPSGQNIRTYSHPYNKYINLNLLKCYNNIDINRAILSLGTLGGGERMVATVLVNS